VTWLGATVVTIPALALVGGTLARRSRSWAPVVDIVAVYGTAVLAHAVAGSLVQRTRPPAVDWLVPASGWAYPSGHTTQAVAAWGMLALLLSVGARPRRRVGLVAAAVIVSLAVGVSRIYLGVHWATDVLGGAMLSIGVLATWSDLRRSAFQPSTTEAASSSSQPARSSAVDSASRDRARGGCHRSHGPLQASGRVFMLSRATRDGIGAAYRAGFSWALVTADVAVGSRRLVLGLPVHDTTAGSKAFRHEALEQIGAIQDWLQTIASSSRRHATT
jgi:membrane-associated phospholipid phosphatase